jgi:hypothetical protein
MAISFELYQVRDEGTPVLSSLQKVTRKTAVSEEDGVVVPTRRNSVSIT